MSEDREQRTEDNEQKTEGGRGKREFVNGNAEVGLRPVGAIGAYAPEGRWIDYCIGQGACRLV